MAINGNPKRAIVLGGNVNGLGVVRSLGRLGVRSGVIYVPEDDHYVRRSRYVVSSRAVAAEIADSDLRSVLDQVAESLGGNRLVLIPTTDRFSQFLSRNQESMRERYYLNCPQPELVDAFLDKWKTAKICREKTVRIPDTFCPMTESELRQVARDIRYPVIIKPRYTFSGTFPGKNATAENEEDLVNFFLQNDIFGDAVVQEIIPSGDGDILAIASYSDSNGKVRASVCWRKLRQYRPDYGATCYGVTESHPELDRLNRGFLEAIGYKGFAMSEFAQSRADAQMYFLELNTRSSWPNQLFADAGVDLTQLAYIDMTRTDSGQIDDLVPRAGVIWLDLPRDRASARIKREQGEIGLWEWLFSLTKARSFAHWNLRDPLPFVMTCCWRARRILRKVFRI